MGDRRSASRERSASPRSEAPPQRDARPNVYLYGLTDNVDDRHLDDIFGQYGPLARIRVRRDTARRSAILEYDLFEDAEKAVEHMDHGQIDGALIRAVLQEDTSLDVPVRPRRDERRDERHRGSGRGRDVPRDRGWGRDARDRGWGNDTRDRGWGRPPAPDRAEPPRDSGWRREPSYEPRGPSPEAL